MKTIQELSSLKGRVALVTGATGKIGSVLSETLAELGADLVLVDLDQSAGQALAATLEHKWSVRALPVTVDLTEGGGEEIFPQVYSAFGRLDVLINCAALVGASHLQGWNVPFEEQSPESWRLALETNVTAATFLVQKCAPLLAASGHGSVINILSIYGLVGPDLRIYEGTSMHNPAAYAASKGAMLQMTRWLATVLAPKIRVNAISPGGVLRGQPESFVHAYAQRAPLQRMATEEDFKGAVAYLASDLSAYVTGQNLIVDGGWTTW